MKFTLSWSAGDWRYNCSSNKHTEQEHNAYDPLIMPINKNSRDVVMMKINNNNSLPSARLLKKLGVLFSAAVEPLLLSIVSRIDLQSVTRRTKTSLLRLNYRLKSPSDCNSTCQAVLTEERANICVPEGKESSQYTTGAVSRLRRKGQ